jgi:hypothetical protein
MGEIKAISVDIIISQCQEIVPIIYDPFTSSQRLDGSRSLGTVVREALGIGDLILTEVLQGFSGEAAFNQARKLPTSPTMTEILIRTDQLALRVAI